MVYNHTQPYRDLHSACKVLLARIQSPDVSDRYLPGLVRELRETEAFKREFRGIPRLSMHSLEDFAKGRLATAKRLSRSNPPETPYTELDATEAKPAEETPAQTDVPPQAT